MNMGEDHIEAAIISKDEPDNLITIFNHNKFKCESESDNLKAYTR